MNRGQHLCSWYSGDEHFVAKALAFVTEGIAANQQIHVVLPPALMAQLLERLEAAGIPHRPSRFVQANYEDLKRIQELEGVETLRAAFTALLAGARAEGYADIRIVGHVAHQMRMTGTSLESFLRWEQAFHASVSGLFVASLCLYDASLDVDEAELRHCHDDCLL